MARPASVRGPRHLQKLRKNDTLSLFDARSANTVRSMSGRDGLSGSGKMDEVRLCARAVASAAALLREFGRTAPTHMLAETPCALVSPASASTSSKWPEPSAATTWDRKVIIGARVAPSVLYTHENVEHAGRRGEERLLGGHGPAAGI